MLLQAFRSEHPLANNVQVTLPAPTFEQLHVAVRYSNLGRNFVSMSAPLIHEVVLGDLRVLYAMPIAPQ